jgi:hypothetical protein
MTSPELQNYLTLSERGNVFLQHRDEAARLA